MRFRSLLAAGVALALSIAGPAFAGNITTFTGPAGTNPALNPQNLSDLNTIINGVNNNAAFAGTTTPSQVIGATSLTSTKLSPNPATILEFVTNVTSTTGSTTCNAASSTECAAVVDPSGNLRWIPLY